MSRRTIRPVLAILTAGLLALVGAVPAAIAVPVLLDTGSGPGFEISLFTDADSPGWVDAEITNTTAATVTFGLGASGSSPTDIVHVWDTGWTDLDDFATETVDAGQTLEAGFPLWSGATVVFYTDPLGTPVEVWRTTLPGPFLPFSAGGTADTIDLHPGYDVAISPSTARIGEEPYIVAEIGVEVATAEVWAITIENFTVLTRTTGPTTRPWAPTWGSLASRDRPLPDRSTSHSSASAPMA